MLKRFLLIASTCLLTFPTLASYQSLSHYPYFLNNLDLTVSPQAASELKTMLNAQQTTNIELIRGFTLAFPGLATWLGSAQASCPVSRHTRAVLQLIDDQYDFWNFGPLPGVENLRAVLRAQVVLSDIGSHAAMKNHAQDFTAPIMKRVMEQLEFNSAEQQLALALSSHDMFDTLAALPPAQALQQYETIALKHAMDLPTYLRLQLFVSVLSRTADNEHF